MAMMLVLSFAQYHFEPQKQILRHRYLLLLVLVVDVVDGVEEVMVLKDHRSGKKKVVSYHSHYL